MYEGGAVTDRMHEKWFAKFHAGDLSLDDALWSGRPVEVDSDQTETLTENNQHYTIQEITNILKISKSIKLLVEIKKMCILWKKNKRQRYYDFSIVTFGVGHHQPQVSSSVTTRTPPFREDHVLGISGPFKRTLM